MKKIFSALLTVAITTGLSAQVLVSEFNFNAAGNANSSGNAGTFSALGGPAITTASDTVNGGSSDPAPGGVTGARNLNGGFPAQGAGSGTAGARIDVTTVGFDTLTYSGLIVEFDLRISNTASRWYRIDYTTDGVGFTLGTPVRIGGASDSLVGDIWNNNISFAINDPLALNNANFGFRVMSVFSPIGFTEHSSSTVFAADTAYEAARNWTGAGNGNYGAAGTWRFDMIQVFAVPIPEPSTYALLALAVVGIVFVRRRILARSAANK